MASHTKQKTQKSIYKAKSIFRAQFIRGFLDVKRRPSLNGLSVHAYVATYTS